MAGFLQEFVTWLATEDVLNLTVGSNLFLGGRPGDATDNCTVIMMPPGGQAISELPSHAYPTLKFTTRGVDYTTARDEAYRIRQVLQGQAGVAITANHFVFGIEIQGAPGALGLDGQNRHEFESFYLVRYEETP